MTNTGFVTTYFYFYWPILSWNHINVSTDGKKGDERKKPYHMKAVSIPFDIHRRFDTKHPGDYGACMIQQQPIRPDKSFYPC